MATTKITSPDLFNLESLNSALKLPSGTTAQRPTSPSTGEWRYNTTTNLVEFWDGGAWKDLQSENIPPINSENFNTVLYTGNGSTQSITGVGFKPDLVWVKVRSTTGSGPLADSSRGTGKAVYSNLSDADYTFPAGQGVTSFDSDGFSVGDDSTGNGGYNGNGKTYVAWCWKANGGTTTAGSGTNTTSVTNQANTKAGFSISTFTGSATAAGNFTHGLGEVPDMYLVKSLSFSDTWFMYHKDLGNGSNAQEYALRLNTTAAQENNSGFWNNTAPTSTLISINSGILVNNATYVAYAFKSIAGYSSFGSFVGNGSTNGPIVNTGFEPAFVMTKRSSTTGGWVIWDNKRSTTNPRLKYLQANVNNAEGTLTGGIDFLSNGFQLRDTDAELNGNGDTLIYIAFAADPSATPTLADSFANKLYDGNGGTQSITGLGFSPSWVWIKKRNGSEDHAWFDVVRGVQRQISSNLTAAGYTTTNAISSFDADGWTTGNNGATNASGETYVAWNWKASPVPAINTDGTNQTIVSANQAAGFSIVGWTGGSSSTATCGHGLSSAPEVIIQRPLNASSDWFIYHKDLTSGNSLRFTTAAQSTSVGFTVDSSIFHTDWTNTSYNWIAYCFNSVSGFSKMGIYNGSGSDGNVVATGFKPSWVMIKRSNSSGGWLIFDSARSPSNPVNDRLEANNNQAEQTNSGDKFLDFNATDFEANGSDSELNASGGTYIYMAFKENPVQYPISSGYMGYLVVAGGGGGGAYNGGGGGSGGLRTTYGTASGGGASVESNITLSAQTYTITVGAGGSGQISNTASISGSSSSVASITSIGGGSGGGAPSPFYGPNNGGSGGGGAYAQFTTGGTGTANQGFAGGDGDGGVNSGGGGGAGSAGTDATGAGGTGGNGGNGLTIAITGSSGGYAGGGGGAGYPAGAGAAGGASSGGGAGGANSAGGAGTANTGGGGGGSQDTANPPNNPGGNGGSGVVVLRLNTSDYSGTTTGSPTVTTNGSETILTYTGSGTYVHS